MVDTGGATKTSVIQVSRRPRMGRDRMVELLTSPWDDRFDELVTKTKSSFYVCAPYVGVGPCKRLVSAFGARGTRQAIGLTLLTDLSRDNILSGATDVTAIASLVESLPQTSVRFLPRLHAKIYVSDMRRAVVTSANLTDNGLRRNFEYGVVLNARAEVAKVYSDVANYGNLGSIISLPQLQSLAEIAHDLRGMRSKAEASLKRKLKREFDKRLEEMDEYVLRARAGDRSLDAILSEAILYLLRKGPMRTTEIHPAVQRIHPDLCDDSIDRVIDGRSFGKKWKHAVRRAQYHLKQRGIITLVGGQWSLVD